MNETKTCTFRVTEEEKWKLKSAATSAKMSLQDYILLHTIGKQPAKKQVDQVDQPEQNQESGKHELT